MTTVFPTLKSHHQLSYLLRLQDEIWRIPFCYCPRQQVADTQSAVTVQRLGLNINKLTVTVRSMEFPTPQNLANTPTQTLTKSREQPRPHFTTLPPLAFFFPLFSAGTTSVGPEEGKFNSNLQVNDLGRAVILRRHLTVDMSWNLTVFTGQCTEGRVL